MTASVKGLRILCHFCGEDFGLGFFFFTNAGNLITLIPCGRGEMSSEEVTEAGRYQRLEAQERGELGAVQS